MKRKWNSVQTFSQSCIPSHTFNFNANIQNSIYLKVRIMLYIDYRSIFSHKRWKNDLVAYKCQEISVYINMETNIVENLLWVVGITVSYTILLNKGVVEWFLWQTRFSYLYATLYHQPKKKTTTNSSLCWTKRHTIVSLNQDKDTARWNHFQN